MSVAASARLMSGMHGETTVQVGAWAAASARLVSCMHGETTAEVGACHACMARPLCRLVRGLALNSSRCQQALRETATPLVFLQALRILNGPGGRGSERGASGAHPRRSFDSGGSPARAIEAQPETNRPSVASACRSPDGFRCSGVELKTLRYAAVGGTVIVACRHVKTKSASRTFRNYGRLCSTLLSNSACCVPSRRSAARRSQTRNSQPEHRILATGFLNRSHAMW